MAIALDTINACTKGDFIDTLGGIFEHSPWVAEAVVGNRPFMSIDLMHRAMVAAIAEAGSDAQVKLISAHPDLAGKAVLSGELTAESTFEQKGAGLDSLTAEEYERFHKLNDAYKERFGFPFILAVRGHDKHSILAAFETRLKNTQQQEQDEALAQIARIGAFRLHDLIKE